ncbi:MAG: hypothetical protein KIT58_21300 [Planctomycetota bacterium]|nr:hypothetical protein [Planctomycetota bacterium]
MDADEVGRAWGAPPTRLLDGGAGAARQDARGHTALHLALDQERRLALVELLSSLP